MIFFAETLNLSVLKLHPCIEHVFVMCEPPLKGRKTRKCLTVAERLKVIEEHKSGKSENEIAKELEVSRKQIQNIVNNRERLVDGVKNRLMKPTDKVTVKTSKYGELDEAVFRWFQVVQNPHGRRKPLPVSRSILQARAEVEANRLNITNFKASNGWFDKWRIRYAN